MNQAILEFFYKDKHQIKQSLEDLLLERLNEKSALVIEKLDKNINSWEETIYQMIARYFGLNKNRIAFETLTASLPLNILLHHKNSSFQIEALLFGQANLLEERNADTYQTTLIREYNFFKKKYEIQPIDKNLWQHTYLRQQNSPEIRVAQFANFIYKSQSVFSKIINYNSISDIKNLLKVKASKYWDTHYSFSDYSSRKTKRVGQMTVDIITINAIIPTIFAYGQYKKEDKYKERAIEYLKMIDPERNSKIKECQDSGFILHNAGETQAILQLYKHINNN